MIGILPPISRLLKSMYVPSKYLMNLCITEELTNIKLLFLQSDGGYDVHKQLDLSGEPLIPPLCEVFKLKPPFSAIRCQELTIQGRGSCEAYSDYWNTMTADDVTAVEHCLLLESANYLACQVRRLTLS